MSIPLSNARVGVYVDGHSVSANGGHGMRYDVLREFATRDGAEAIRMNVYLPWDAERAAEDAGYRRGQENFAATLRDFGYKVVRKTVRRTTDEQGTPSAKANTELALAMDALRQSEHLERVLLVTGEADLGDLVVTLQNGGCRVEVVAFDNASRALREEADMFFSGYLIPNLLPVPQQDRDAWGKTGSQVRGVCYNHSGKGYGFLRYLRESAPGLWITDSRREDSPYDTVFFHDSQLPRNVAFHELPSRELLFEFELTESDRFENDLQAVNLRLVGAARRARDEADAREAASREDIETRGGAWRREDDAADREAEEESDEYDLEFDEEEGEEVPDHP
jgi:uncharacterized LabA/DUF88 family protein